MTSFSEGRNGSALRFRYAGSMCGGRRSALPGPFRCGKDMRPEADARVFPRGSRRTQTTLRACYRRHEEGMARILLIKLGQDDMVRQCDNISIYGNIIYGPRDDQGRTQRTCRLFGRHHRPRTPHSEGDGRRERIQQSRTVVCGRIRCLFRFGDDTVGTAQETRCRRCGNYRGGRYRERPDRRRISSSGGYNGHVSGWDYRGTGRRADGGCTRVLSLFKSGARQHRGPVAPQGAELRPSGCRANHDV